ncbi:MAG: outer membrane beta-barrel protein [Bacteroidia bacterium]
MRKLRLCFVFITISFIAFSQSDTTKRFLGIVPKIDIFWPACDLITKNTTCFDFSIEKEIGSHESIELTYQYNTVITVSLTPVLLKYPNIYENSFIRTSNRESQIMPEFRYYFGKFNKHNHSHLYAGIYPELLFMNKTSINLYSNESTGNQPETDLAIGLDIGFKTYIFKRIVLDFLIGDATSEVLPLSNWANFSQDAYFRLSVDVGYRF